MRVVQKISMDMLLNSHDVEYFGMIDEDTFFAIYRSDQDGDNDSFKVSMGPRDNLKEVEVIDIMRYRSGTVVINTVAGTFSFPSPHCKDKRSLFCSWPIELL